MMFTGAGLRCPPGGWAAQRAAADRALALVRATYRVPSVVDAVQVLLGRRQTPLDRQAHLLDGLGRPRVQLLEISANALHLAVHGGQASPGIDRHVVLVARSEERRVGKECRSRWR